MWNLPRPTGLNFSEWSASFEESHAPLISVSKNPRHVDFVDEHFTNSGNFWIHDIHFPESKVKPSSVPQEVQLDSDEQAVQEFGQCSLHYLSMLFQLNHIYI